MSKEYIVIGLLIGGILFQYWVIRQQYKQICEMSAAGIELAEKVMELVKDEESSK